MHVDWRYTMSRTNYSKQFKLMVAKEALLPENKNLEHVIADKYGIMPWTVIRWRNHLAEVGEDKAFRKGFTKSDQRTDREKELEKENAELREEVEILKKAAAFLANVKRD
jgi:transposase